ncbi:MAG: ATP-dependent 6-phosphofructokinase [bacterium]|nr:ATP-dependent 6-phosphofructokinase [bacterium]
MKKVGFLTSGGDCQSLNATMRATVKALCDTYKEIQIIGILDGYKGLIYGNYITMCEKDFEGILSLGGTILGTSRQPFKQIQRLEENGFDKIEAMVRTYNELALDCLIILGGNGSHKTANLLSTKGLNIITLPKTIDNDIWGTDVTFGFYSAVDVATYAIDCIHTTASSHSRVFVVEVMGHKVGWLTLHAGVAAGADAIIIPEIPYDIHKIADLIKRQKEAGKNYTILAVAEGAKSVEDSQLTKKEYKEKLKGLPYPSISYKIGEEIEALTGEEVRITIPGHMQRGGGPNAYDRILSSRMGSAAAAFVKEGMFGYMVGIRNHELVPVPLYEVAGKLKQVDPDSAFIKEIKDLGIVFGD